MTFRSKIAVLAGKAAKWALTTFTQGGSSFPGKLALSIDPNILEYLSRNYEVAIVTGTNGKTLTTALSVALLNQHSGPILTNSTGSNMQQGIITCFLSQDRLAEGQKGLAILEVDEGSLKHVVKYLQPKVFVHTNIFQDQMDRYGSTHATYDLLVQAAKEVPTATIIANGDSPILNSVALNNPRQFFGFQFSEDETEITEPFNGEVIDCPRGHGPLAYHGISYANQGDYYCPTCDFKRPDLTYRVTQLGLLTIDESNFEIDGYSYRIPVAGIYNIYNALAAYSLARFFGLSQEEIAQGFSKAQRVFGRQENLEIAGHKVLINLVKNSAGLNQVIDLVGLDQEPMSLFIILNNDYADGQDISWIWQGQFDKMLTYNIQEIHIGGTCQSEIYQRLEAAGFQSSQMEVLACSSDEVIGAIKEASTEHVHIFTSYTAMLQLRKDLIVQGYLSQSQE